MQAVTVLISRQVKPEYEVEFERVMDQIIATAATFKGYLGAHLVRPGDEQGVNDSLHHVVMAFDSEANLDLWQNSPARSLGLAAAAPFIEGQALIRHVSGLAHWFLPRGESKQVPPAAMEGGRCHLAGHLSYGLRAVPGTGRFAGALAVMGSHSADHHTGGRFDDLGCGAATDSVAQAMALLWLKQVSSRHR